MVHRLLAASLKLMDLPESSKDRDSVRLLADNLNVRHRNAQMAGRASVELHTLIFFKDKTVLADARITKVPQFLLTNFEFQMHEFLFLIIVTIRKI